MRKDGTMPSKDEHDKDMEDIINSLLLTRLSALRNDAETFEKNIDQEQEYIVGSMLIRFD